ncbi:MAG: hypothetical protein ACD_51C00354G0010 [uncultured bacterium]|nr:MAG: hypothetical protein ACD_51C00354G0010 [uncultured bacterium]
MNIHDLLKSSLTRLTPYIEKNHLEAYRIYNNTDRTLPLAIDIYQNNAVIHIFAPISEGMAKEIEQSLKSLLGIQDFFYKNRTKKEIQIPKSSPQKEITVKEYGHSFSINLSDYLDTGLFLDHRETRKWIASKSLNKTILNTFAYTGSFTIYAACAGAAKTYSVDLSKTYCEWIKKNLALNNLPPEKNWTYKMDTLEFFKYAKRKNFTFDIIIIDPPTFSKNKGKNFSVQKDHPDLINGALDLLNPRGLIMFSNNFRDFLMETRRLQPCSINKEISMIPPDFNGIPPHHCFIIKKQ